MLAFRSRLDRRHAEGTRRDAVDQKSAVGVVARDVHQMLGRQVSAELTSEQIGIIGTDLKHHHASGISKNSRQNLGW